MSKHPMNIMDRAVVSNFKALLNLLILSEEIKPYSSDADRHNSAIQIEGVYSS